MIEEPEWTSAENGVNEEKIRKLVDHFAVKFNGRLKDIAQYLISRESAQEKRIELLLHEQERICRDFMEMIELKEQSQAREAELRKALDKYSKHAGQCRYVNQSNPCTCGLDEILIELADDPGEGGRKS